MDEIKFTSKSREYGWLSNFHLERFVYKHQVWRSVENFYQAHKSLDTKVREEVCGLSPSLAKQYGKSIKLRPHWDKIKDVVMYQALLLKFVQNKGLREQLENTGNARLIEDAPWDNYWGSGRQGDGLNRLGQLLMKVRYELRTAPRVIICGDRNWSDPAPIQREVYKLPITAVVIEGEAPGADSIAGRCAECRQMTVYGFPANWDLYGKSAGPRRNQQMINSFDKIDLVLAFHPDIMQSKGTKDMIKRAELNKIEVRSFSE